MRRAPSRPHWDCRQRRRRRYTLQDGCADSLRRARAISASPTSAVVEARIWLRVLQMQRLRAMVRKVADTAGESVEQPGAGLPPAALLFGIGFRSALDTRP